MFIPKTPQWTHFIDFTSWKSSIVQKVRSKKRYWVDIM